MRFSTSIILVWGSMAGLYVGMLIMDAIAWLKKRYHKKPMAVYCLPEHPKEQ